MLFLLSYLQSLHLHSVGSLPLVVLPLILELAVLARAVHTRESTDMVLAAVAVPCLLVSMWAVTESLNPSGGVYWGGLFSVAAGGLLTFIVVTDAIMGYIVGGRATE